MSVWFWLLYRLYRIYAFFVRPVTFGVRVVMVKDGQVLLIRHTYVDGWYFPGGGLKRGETPEAAARREVKEEAGAEVGELRLLGLYSSLDSWRSDHTILFLARDFTWTGVHDAEIAEVRLFPLDGLPADLWTGFRRRLEEIRTGAQSPKFGAW